MHRALRLGLFVVATLAILAVAVFLIGNRQMIFRSTYRLRAQFDNVSGLNNGAEVRVGGIHEGTIKQIDLPSRPDGKVVVVMDLESGTRSVVKKDSQAAIKSEGLLGDKYVEISFGSKDAGDVKNGDTIASQPPLEISDLFKKADEMLDTAQGAVVNIAAATGSLKSIGSKVDEGKGTIGALINDKKTYQEVTAGATAFDENMEALKHNFLLRGFFKKRGYEDSEDLTKYEIARLPMGPSLKTFEYDAGKIFDKPDTAKLKNQKALNDAGAFLAGNKFGLAVVAVSAGTTGDSDKDRTLTEARSLVIREYLAKNYQFDDARLKTIGLGKAVQPEESDKVEIVVYPVTVAGNR
jgi:phospholipid/cholesterol/gamma-HCH transport system substrate-binding protein